MQRIQVINAFLGIVAVVLFITLFLPPFSPIGKASSFLHTSEPVCDFVNEGQKHPLTIDQCCQTIRSMAMCEKDQSVGYRCFVKRDSSKFLEVNSKAYRFCNGES